jgi:signal transduction histidine kinase
MLVGETAASIAHEVNQPIAANVTNASAALRWLAAQPPDLEEVRQALGRIVKDGTHLFDTFYTTKPEGMGMGLAISRSIIEAHGGRLWATADEPHGAVFQFTLPPDADEMP